MRYRLTFVVGLTVGYVLGARAGRERYEQLRRGAERIARNPAVRNTAESATHSGRDMATRAFEAMTHRLPDPVVEKVRSMGNGGTHPRDDWGTGTT
jgi:hypothetical protein